MANSYPERGPEWSNPNQPAYTEPNIWAIASVISGVLSWLGLFGLGGVVAVIAGHVAKNQIRASAGRMAGNDLATIGLVLGYANIAISAIGLCLGLLVLFGVIGMPFICVPFVNLFNAR